MNRSSTLFRTALAEIARFDHPSHSEHHDDEAEMPSSYAVSFVEAGSYTMGNRSASWLLTVGDMELTYPGIPVPVAGRAAGGNSLAMQLRRLVHVSLLWVAALQAGPALAQQAGHGVIELDDIADRPQAGGNVGNGYGYEVTAAYAASRALVVFGEYERLLNTLRPGPLGSQQEKEYESGFKLTHALTPEVAWISELGYEVADVEAAAVASAERGYDLVQGLRIMPTPRLELIADLHYETVGAATTAIVLGFVQGFASRYAFEGILEHSRSEGRFDNNYRLGLRVYL